MSEDRPEFNAGGIVAQARVVAPEPGEEIIPVRLDDRPLTVADVLAYCRRRCDQAREVESELYKSASDAIKAVDTQRMKDRLAAAHVARTRANLYEELAGYLEAGKLPD